MDARQHFETLYRQWDTEEIERVVAGELQPTAREAAIAVLEERGAGRPVSGQGARQSDEREDRQRDANALWQSGLVKAAQGVCAVSTYVGLRPLLDAFRSVSGMQQTGLQPGAAAVQAGIAAVLAIGAGLIGLYFGTQIARSISRSESTTIPQKRGHLYLLIAGALIVGISCHASLASLLGRVVGK